MNSPSDNRLSNEIEDARKSEVRHYFDILRKFQKRSFLNHGDCVVRGFVRKKQRVLGDRHVVPGIVGIVATYYVDGEAGIFQLGFNIHALTKRANLRTISDKILRKLMVKFLERRAIVGTAVNAKRIDFYRAELVRLGYLKVEDRRLNGLESNAIDSMGPVYTIPLGKQIEFSCLKSSRGGHRARSKQSKHTL